MSVSATLLTDQMKCMIEFKEGTVKAHSGNFSSDFSIFEFFKYEIHPLSKYKKMEQPVRDEFSDDESSYEEDGEPSPDDSDVLDMIEVPQHDEQEYPAKRMKKLKNESSSRFQRRQSHGRQNRN